MLILTNQSKLVTASSSYKRRQTGDWSEDSLWCIRQVYWSSVERLPSFRSIIAFWHTRCTDAFQVPSCCFGGWHCKSLPSGPEADQDVLRFLWIDDPDNEHPNIVVKRFNRVVFGVTSSPFLLNATIRHHVTKYEVCHPQFVSDFLASLYMDDFKMGKDSVPEAFESYKR